jgi:hypothetical protein
MSPPSEQDPKKGGMVAARRNHQRSESPAVTRVDVGAAIEQREGGLGMVVGDRRHEGRHPVGASRVRRNAGGEESPDLS